MSVARNLKLVNYMIKLYEINVILISDIVMCSSTIIEHNNESVAKQQVCGS